MAKKSIKRRWITNNLGVIALILLVIVLTVIYAVQNYFYNSARQYLVSKINAVNGVLTRYAADSGTNLSAEIRSTLESFSDKDKMELMAIDYDGRIVLTSSGFTPDFSMDMSDYDDAMKAENTYGFSTGKTDNGERIMAVSYSIADISEEYSAIRVVTSLETIDNTIAGFVVFVTLIALAVLLLLGLSNLYFVVSILRPIREINANTEKFAQGDFSARINQESDDEIGELCAGINHMADELSTAETMKNEFISSVSHELRTPLTAIKGWADTLSDLAADSSSGKAEPDPEMMQKGLHIITGETERLSEMVEELLDFSRIQSGHFTLQMDTMDVLAELGDAVLIYMERAKKDKIRVIYEEPEMLPFVYGDKNRIRQVFINVIDNAIKYSDPDGLVEITAESAEDGNAVRVIVRDHGCGIKKSDLSKVKTKFYKPNHTRRGSGIGLAVADEIVSMHHGTLEIDSEEGIGTTVTVTLPAKSSSRDSTA
ncbi:MAG: HAMP domain-containing histidine kinase [Oscillospiraceae bacterium]|nr:HAMP domain-containing histidine kinase [Oscillospiraceae bacterium]